MDENEFFRQAALQIVSILTFQIVSRLDPHLSPRTIRASSVSLIGLLAMQYVQ